MTGSTEVGATDEELMDFTSNYLAFQKWYQPVKIEDWETPAEPVQFSEFKSATLRHLRQAPHQFIRTLDKSYLRDDPLWGILCFYASHRGEGFNARDRSHLHRLAIQRYNSLAGADNPRQLINEALAARAGSMSNYWKSMHWPYPNIAKGR